jgi:hypothetical protein
LNVTNVELIKAVSRCACHRFGWLRSDFNVGINLRRNLKRCRAALATALQKKRL